MSFEKKLEINSLILHMQIHESSKFRPLKAKKEKKKKKGKKRTKITKTIPSLEGFIFLVS
jgi:hypothetical protein